MNNILYIETFPGLLSVGGSTISLLHLVKGLDKSEYRPIVLFYHPNKYLAKFQEANAKAYCFYRKQSVLNRKQRPTAIPDAFDYNEKSIRNTMKEEAKALFRNLPNLKNMIRISRIIIENDIHLVHMNSGVRQNLDGLYAALMTGKPVVFHDREVPEALNFYHKIISGKARRIICVSNAVKFNYIRYGVSEDKLSVLYNCVDLREAKPSVSVEAIRKELTVERSFVLGVVGSIVPWKGQDTVLRAMLHLSTAGVKDIHCFFVGDCISTKTAFYKQRLKEMTEEYGLANRITFTGFVENVYDYINAVDVIVHSSIRPEPFGRVLIEAMALKKPVIAANAGGVPEIVEDGQSGLLYEPGNSQQLASAINCLYQSKILQQEFGEKGYEAVASRFTLPTHMKEIQTIYRTILA